jgi:ubiquinone/menaquinone biosynthesis C-methylase UbiE
MMMKCFFVAVCISSTLLRQVLAFTSCGSTSLFPSSTTERFVSVVIDDALDSTTVEESSIDDNMERRRLKQSLLSRFGGDVSQATPSYYDPILADPTTKEPLRASIVGPILSGGSTRSGVRLSLTSMSNADRIFEGRTDTYINLLEPATIIDEDADDEKGTTSMSPILSSLLAFTPPPLRSIIAEATGSNLNYIPMRDLFTSPQVSFAYERGWRQGFAAAGFPGPDKEFDMANDYFAPSIDRKRKEGKTKKDDVLIDMSCATGLFSRRFAKSKLYSRVIACDYSDSMLTEARRRIQADPEIASSSSTTKLDLVRCDVAKIPMRSDSVDAFHAGAAMHCWPEIELSLKEIYRVLVPGGRYFATTFLSSYFAGVAGVEKTANGGTDVPINVQAFQYFPSEKYLRDLLIDAGFEESKVNIEVLGRACVVMRCEK